MLNSIQEARAFIAGRERDEIQRWRTRLEKTSTSAVLAQAMIDDLSRRGRGRLSVKEMQRICRRGVELIDAVGREA
jgi:hypothetical protein